MDNVTGVATASAELYDPATGNWSATGSLATGRSRHAAALLPNGKVLVASGYNDTFGNVVSAEIYDPATGTWSTTANLNLARYLHSATTLPDGKVLVVGGSDSGNGNDFAGAELYDPATGKWTSNGNLATPRDFHTATSLANGQVLIAGGEAGASGAALASAELYDPTSPAQSHNISTRLRVRTGDNALIGGFILTGSDSKTVIIRALGPSLAVAGHLENPTLALRDGSGGLIAFNDDWKDNQRAQIEATSIPPTNDLELAIVITLPANNASYTAIVRGKDDSIKIGQVEVYDLAAGANSKLANISTRGFVETGDNAMIGGFILGPAGTGGSKVIVRALGPSLGVGGALSDPTLELHSGNGDKIASNDNWKTSDATGQSQEADIRATGIPPNNDLEAAIVATLPPDNYTAIVAGKNGGAGVGLVAVHNLQ